MTKNVIFILLFSYASVSNADILLVQALDMGHIVVANNDTPQEIILNDFNVYQADPGFRIIERGQIGIYMLTDLPPSSTVNVTINVVNTLMDGDSNSLEAFDFEIVRQEETVLSDENGEAELRFGGKITTSGSGAGAAFFTDTIYRSNFNIIINN